jgi:oxygen-independent coproporphyrinogen-3 oxidase
VTPHVDADDFGVYVHIPFCAQRCDYCAFATWDDRPHLIEHYLDALLCEARRAAAVGMPPVTSVFIGGGTPSAVDPHRLAAVIGALPIAVGAEITAEANPDDVTPALLEGWGAAGVTRVSLGVQSLDPVVLRGLGRTHDPDNVAIAVQAVRSAGIVSVNLDLIYGSPHETDVSWCRSIEGVVALRPDHVSAYALTVEPGTPLSRDPARHPDADEQADRYLLADRSLSTAGLEWYEVSNWSRAGHESRHNLLYWSGGDYLGLGCAAHSHRSPRRWWNLRTPERYIEAVEAGRPTEAAGETLGPEAARIESLQLALRTRRGVPTDALRPEDVELLPGGLVEAFDRRWVLTPEGRLMANEVALRLR